MQMHLIKAKVFGQVVETSVPAGSLSEAVNKFVSQTRVTKIVDLKQNSGGMKTYELTIRTGDGDVTGTLKAPEIFQPLYASSKEHIVIESVEEIEGSSIEPAPVIPTN